MTFPLVQDTSLDCAYGGFCQCNPLNVPFCALNDILSWTKSTVIPNFSYFGLEYVSVK